MPRAARGVSYGGDTLCVARPEGVSFVLLMTPAAARLALSPAAPFPLFAKPKAPSTHSARSPHECARDPPGGRASAAGLLLFVRSDGTASHVAPPAPPRGVARHKVPSARSAVATLVFPRGTISPGKNFIRWKNFQRSSSSWFLLLAWSFSYHTRKLSFVRGSGRLQY